MRVPALPRFIPVSRGHEGGSLATVFARGMSSNAVALLANLASGVLIARTLGPSGRGEIAAVLAAASVPYLLTFGCQRAVAFHQARHPEDAGRLLTTWLLLLTPLVAVGIAALEALVPVLLAQQTPHTQMVARIWIATSVVLILSRIPMGILLGDHDFSFYYVIGCAQPVVIAVGYALIAATDSLSVTTALVVSGLTFAIGTLGSFARVLRRHGLKRPSLQLARRTGSYALRAQGGDLGSGVNARLDVLIIPAYLSAASVGFYSVATNVSWIVFSLAGALSLVVLPAAARDTRKAPQTVIASLYVTLLVALVGATTIGLLARPAVTLVYGQDFGGAVFPLRILLSAVVLYSLAQVLLAGLYGSNRPLMAAGAEGAGALVSVIGLVFVLPSRGIAGAAFVSLLSYATVLVGAVVLYRYSCVGSWAMFRPHRELLGRLRVPLQEQVVQPDRVPRLRQATASRGLR